MWGRSRSAAVVRAQAALAAVSAAAAFASCSGARTPPARESSAPADIEGVVLDPSGKPVANVLVAVRAGRLLDFRRAVPAATAVTGPDGRFRLPAPNPEARDIVTAYLGGTGAARWGPEYPTHESVALKLASGIRLSGIVRMPDDKPAAGARVRAVAGTLEASFGDFPVVFPAVANADGSFAIEVPRNDEYVVFADLDGYSAPGALARDRADAKYELRLRAMERSAAADDGRAAAWLRSAAQPMQAGGDADDLAPLDSLVKGARVLALGEHSHGTREFHTFRDRVFRRLVERHSFTVLGVEASYYRVARLDRFVQTGEGDPEEILAETYPLNSRDLIAQLKWMHAWNADRRHSRKLRIVGFDIWTNPVGGDRIRAFLERVDPERAPRLGPAIAELASYFIWDRKTSNAEIAFAEMIGRALDDEARARWKVGVTEAELQIVRHDARLLASNTRVHHGGSVDAYAQRDPAMAANIRAMLDANPGEKILVYAHGAHIARWDLPFGMPAMGKYLGDALREDYRTIGLAFGEGSYWTTDCRPAEPKLDVVTIGPAPPRTFESLLAQAGPSHFVDFRAAPPEVTHWLWQPRLMRLADEEFTDEESLEVSFPPRAYDAMFYVSRSTPVLRVSRPPGSK
jgi:erythromycin esterase